MYDASEAIPLSDTGDYPSHTNQYYGSNSNVRYRKKCYGSLVSIIITSFNYARFLPLAIESALNQTYTNIEIIVVDDGSTDHSRQIIESYGDKIISIFKRNGGQGSAFNTGFAASNGEVVSFLDADDLFQQEKVAKIMATWQEDPSSSVIYHQLQGIDVAGNVLWPGKHWPQAVWREDIRNRVERSGGWWPWPTTSGLSFSRRFLAKVLPLPEQDFKICPEAYLAGLAPFCGKVVGLGKPLTSYRVHGENYWKRQSVNLQAGYQRKAEQTAFESNAVKIALQDKLGLVTSMDLENHYLYQYYLRQAGRDVSLQKVLTAMVRCPLLPPALKIKEAAKIILNRI